MRHNLSLTGDIDFFGVTTLPYHSRASGIGCTQQTRYLPIWNSASTSRVSNAPLRTRASTPP
jgi:hypothetical protein